MHCSKYSTSIIIGPFRPQHFKGFYSAQESLMQNYEGLQVPGCVDSDVELSTVAPTHAYQPMCQASTHIAATSVSGIGVL